MEPVEKTWNGETMVKDLLEAYQSKKSEIRKRLEEFKAVFHQTDEKLFSELAFCILTPQSKATTSWNAIKSLERNNLLLNGTQEQIRPFLQAVRFGGNKSKYLVEARKLFIGNGELNIKEKLSDVKDNPVLFREWLLKNVKGVGMKESSHFIRNIGLSNNQLAILDVHILKNLKELGVIEDIPKSLTKKKYLEIEAKMKGFADKIGINLDELDILLWSKETGIIFK